MTLIIMTLNIMTLNIMTLNIMTLRIMALRIMTLNIMKLKIMTLSIKNKCNYAEVLMLDDGFVFMLLCRMSFINAECRCAVYCSYIINCLILWLLHACFCKLCVWGGRGCVCAWVGGWMGVCRCGCGLALTYFAKLQLTVVKCFVGFSNNLRP